MITKSGYETNGDYIKFKSGFTGSYAVETEKETVFFKTEYEANMHIITRVVGCEDAYSMCTHYKEQKEGCDNCKFGYNSNCNNGETIKYFTHNKQ